MAACYLLLNLTEKSGIFGNREDDSPMVAYSDQQILKKFRMNKSVAPSPGNFLSTTLLRSSGLWLFFCNQQHRKSKNTIS